MSQNEFISLCSEKGLNAILEERQDAMYYGLIVDATPDVSHQEQNVFYVKNKETSKFEICERFVELLDFNAKTGEDITTEVLSLLDFNMRGKVKGVKTRILEKNNQALFSPCGEHSVNRVCTNAA
ncbi:hypothetical protein PR048_011505 [Dryococelus australis]|uniref:DUF4371 domain-containing protein n=1 Tax=Dryococelus australis TaxID=614101 RepID=A0ABQ9HN26_9NEOP|nr:hypothetical protein PR048_011505 [Dryococelus australis]